MNERLTELYRASRPKEAIASQDEFKSANALLGSDVERFAKLIVEECARELSRIPGGYDSSVFYKNSKLLKEHFGVEE